MSTIELREKLRLLSREERQELLALLIQLEDAEETSAPAPLVPLEEAKAFLYKNCDDLLQRLAH